MINKTEPLEISKIFPVNNSIMYKIPKYQRKYTWGQNEWNLLFNDIVENNDGYFLGSSICVNANNIEDLYSNTKIAEVIDGQQRITTLSILLAVLYTKILKYKTDNDSGYILDEDEITDLNNIKKELAIKLDGKYIPRLQLQVQDNNQADYLALLGECGIIEYSQKKSNAGNRKIYKAFRYFDKLVNNFMESTDIVNKDLKSKNPITTLFNLVNKFNNAIIVVIQVDTHQDAYMLFESLNNRGVPLTAIDLMQNLLISISDKDGKSEACYNDWVKIKNNIGEEYSVQERFFRQYYNAFREELNKPFKTDNDSKMFPLAYLATKTTLMNIYEKIIQYDYDAFLENMKEASSAYAILINNTDEKITFTEELLNLARIQGAPSYLLLLYLSIKNKDLHWNENYDSEMKKIINLLTRFFVRRNLTDTPNTRSLTTLFMNIIEDIKVECNMSIYDTIKKKLVEVSASDDEFKKKLQDSLYDINKEAARYILCSLEQKFQTKEIYTNLWERDEKKNYIWTIEHIFPEGENIPKCWVDMIANGDYKKAQEYQEAYVHTIGNLTISGYNSSLGNKSFEEKKERKKDNKYIGYRNGLYLNTDIVDKEVWTIDLIKARTKKLSEEAIQLFNL